MKRTKGKTLPKSNPKSADVTTHVLGHESSSNQTGSQAPLSPLKQKSKDFPLKTQNKSN
jgi:hypothetical protein